MGVTVFYRGSLDDLGRIDDFEDRVIDLALELGGQGRIWRTTADDNPHRVVRGVILTLCPGQESMSLLISPEGWLINLSEIEEAEKGQLAAPPWCFVKTQFGAIEGHVAVIETLAALKREFLSNLEVRDEGEYWETRNIATLKARLGFLQSAIDGMAVGLREHGLSQEASEDTDILATRIERIAKLVHRTLARPAEHPPVRHDDASDFDEASGNNESHWDASYKENRRRQERIHRAIEEHLAQGDDVQQAFDAAMHEETSLGLPEDPETETSRDWTEDIEAEDDEPWRESLPEAIAEDFDEPARHPLLQRATDFTLRLHALSKLQAESQSRHWDTVFQGAGDIVGGLAQALGQNDVELPFSSGLSVVQLKRALRGAAFAQGAVFPLRADGAIDKQVAEELHNTLESLHTDIYAELERLRERRNESF